MQFIVLGILEALTQDAVPDCIPTVELEVVDPEDGTSLGFIYAWGQDFSPPGGSINSREFILYDLDGGQLFAISEPGGHPGGTFADPTIVIAKFGDQVLLGGAEGAVVGGTGRYAGASGGYSTRRKVEVDFASGFFIYYDELYFRFRDVRVENGRLSADMARARASRHGSGRPRRGRSSRR